MKKILIAVAILAVVIAIAFATGLLGIGRARYQAMSDYKLTTDSSLVLLQQYTKQPLDSHTHIYFVNFWATWCVNCIKEFPNLNDVKSKYNGNPDIRFMSFCDDDSVAATATLQRVNKHLDWEKYYAIKGLRSQLKQICLTQHVPVDTNDGFPSFFMIGRDGKILFYAQGAIAGHEKEAEHVLDSLNALYKE
ncbi:MAG: redoxin family protein [Bacteroidetes bacterium]|nr:redoxin family protein [Bacteroidota bacterium]